MSAKPTQLLVVAMAIVMVTSIMVPFAGATGASYDGETIEQNVATEGVSPTEQPQSGINDAVADSKATGVEIDPALEGTNETVEVVVRLEEQTVPATADREAAITELRQQTLESQEELVSFAENAAGVDRQNRFWIANAVVLEVDTSQVDLETIAALEGVERLHENFAVETPEPVDELDDVGAEDYDTTYGLDQVNAPAVWDDYDTMGEGASVAVLDTGVDPNHDDIDIDPANWAEFDSHGAEIDSEPHDTAEHGTHVSGTVTGGNASGEYIGVAPEATLMHGMVLPAGSGSFAQIAGGIEWAVEEDADVISMSLGADGYHTDMIEPVRNAEAAGTLVVSSSGNSGDGTSGSPGNVYEAFAVGATNSNEGVTSFSSGEELDTDLAWGDAAPAEWPDEYVVPNVAAPGNLVTSAVPGNGYDQLSGTSMAAPHVSGTVALALSAADDDLEPDQVRDGFEQIAWKPDDQSDDQDTRYGHGIVDARLTAEYLGAAQGVEGTVTDADGEPIEGETVSIDKRGFHDDTAADGAYQIRADPGEYTLETSVFGFEDETRDVTVEDGEFASEAFELEPTLDHEVVEEFPDAVISGDAAETTLRTANLEALTVEFDGDYDEANVTPSVDGEQVDFGETVTFDGDADREVTVAVDTVEGTAGEFELEFTLEGLGDEVTVASGPTEVAEESVEVAVVGEDAGLDPAFHDDFVPLLEDELPGDHVITVYEPDDVLETVAADADYDVIVAHNLPSDTDVVEEFAGEARSADVGVVYLDNHWDSNAVQELSEATGNPTHVDSDTHSISPVSYDIHESHPILDGVGEPGDLVAIHEEQLALQQATWFEGYRGDVLADTDLDFYGVPGSGLAVNELERTVVGASLGYSDRSAFTDEADELILNSIEHASQPADAGLVEGQPDHLEPGDLEQVQLDVTFEVDELEEYEVSLGEESTIEADHIELRVNDKVADFDQALAYDDLTDEHFQVTLLIDADQTGLVELDHRFVAGAQSQELTGATGPTVVYNAPLNVPQDAATLEEANDMIVGGTEVVLDDGVHEGTLHLGDHLEDVTITSADGADAVVKGDDEDATATVYSEAPNTRVENVTIDADNHTSAISIDVEEPTIRNVEVRNADLTDDFGYAPDPLEFEEYGYGLDLQFAENPELEGVEAVNTDVGVLISNPGQMDEITVSDITATDSNAGVYVHDLFGVEEAVITDNEVENADHGIVLGCGVGDSTVTDNEVTDSDVGISLGDACGGADDNLVEHNHVTDSDVGISALQFSDDNLVRENTVENGSVGFFFDGGVIEDSTNAPVGGQDVIDNTFDATTGVAVDGEIDPFDDVYTPPETPVYIEESTIRYNDFSAAETGVDNRLGEGNVTDVRLNWWGDGSPTDVAFEGDHRSEPFLTASPDEIDDLDEVSQIGVDFGIEAGDTASLGVPGPTEQTLDEILDTDDAEGVVYAYDGDEQRWTQVTGDYSPSALEALIVVADDDIDGTLTFASDAPASPGQAVIDEGWNFLAAPTHAGVEDAYDSSSATVELAQFVHDRPRSQFTPAGDLEGTYTFGGENPTVSPFEGYFVFASDDGIVPSTLHSNPTMDQLHDALGVDSDSTDASSSQANDVTVETIEERITADELDAATLSPLLYEAFRHELEEAEPESDAEAVAIVETEATELLEAAPEDDRIAVGTALSAASDRLFDEAGAFRPDVVDDEDTPTSESVGATATPIATPG